MRWTEPWCSEKGFLHPSSFAEWPSQAFCFSIWEISWHDLKLSMLLMLHEWREIDNRNNFISIKKYHLGWGWFMPRSRWWTLWLDRGWEMDVSHIGVMCSSIRMQCPSYLQKKANVPLSELTRVCFWEAHSYALPEGFRERTLIWFQGVPFPLFCGCSQRSSCSTHTKKAYTEKGL